MFLRLTAVPAPHQQYGDKVPPPPRVLLINADLIASVVEYGDGDEGVLVVTLTNKEYFYIERDIEEVADTLKIKGRRDLSNL